MPADGRGYTRPPSLIGLWSTAPFLLNNTLGRSTSPVVGAAGVVPGQHRAAALAREAKDPILGDKVPGFIDRTTARNC